MIGPGEVELRPEYFGLGEELARLLVENYRFGVSEKRVVGIGGESCSGKSVTAHTLARAFGSRGIPALVLHQDDYFRRPPRANHEARIDDLSRVGPSEVDLDRMADHVESFRAGSAEFEVPRVEYSTDHIESEKIDVTAVKALIIEGTYVLTLDGLDASVFMRGAYFDTWDRRRHRNRDIDDPAIVEVLAIEHEYIRDYETLADVVVRKDFSIARRSNARARQTRPDV